MEVQIRAAHQRAETRHRSEVHSAQELSPSLGILRWSGTLQCNTLMARSRFRRQGRWSKRMDTLDPTRSMRQVVEDLTIALAMANLFHRIGGTVCSVAESRNCSLHAKTSNIRGPVDETG